MRLGIETPRTEPSRFVTLTRREPDPPRTPAAAQQSYQPALARRSLADHERRAGQAYHRCPRLRLVPPPKSDPTPATVLIKASLRKLRHRYCETATSLLLYDHLVLVPRPPKLLVCPPERVPRDTAGPDKQRSMHPRFLVQIVDRLHVLWRQLDQLQREQEHITSAHLGTTNYGVEQKISDLEIGPHALRIRTFREHDDLPLHQPAHRDLPDRRFVLLRNLRKVLVFEEQRIPLACMWASQPVLSINRKQQLTVRTEG